MRRFVIVGSKAKASGDFLLSDIPGTSGRLDVLLRGLRASLLISHGVRRDTVACLVLQGDPSRTVTVRVDGAAARYLRPDDRSLATIVKKALAVTPAASGFTELRAGISVAEDGLAAVAAELAGSTIYVLDERGEELRQRLPAATPADTTFVLGDHLGLDETTRTALERLGATTALRVGPQSLHTEDVIAIVHNELDRREAVT